MLPSPLLVPLPVEQPAAEWLYQAAAAGVVEAVLWQLIPNAPFGEDGYRWDPLLKALTLWQVWQARGALAGERAAVLRQLYGAAPDAKAITGCWVGLLLRLATTVFAICDELAMQTARVATGDPPLWPPAELWRLVAPHWWGVETAVLEAVALETVVEYAVATYGVERLPRLVQALSDHASWPTLIPAVYGVSAEEVEVGWQAYIAARYGAAPP